MRAYICIISSLNDTFSERMIMYPSLSPFQVHLYVQAARCIEIASVTVDEQSRKKIVQVINGFIGIE